MFSGTMVQCYSGTVLQ